ncbi:hypothetical protein D3C73_1181930 [compost metagenome]
MNGSIEIQFGAFVIRHAVAHEIDRDIGIEFPKGLQAGKQPLRGEGGRGRDVQRFGRLLRGHDLRRGAFQRVQRGPDQAEVGGAHAGQLQPVGGADEQRVTQIAFQRGNVPADGALRHEQLLARLGKRQVARRRGERIQFREGGAAASHEDRAESTDKKRGV